MSGYTTQLRWVVEQKLDDLNLPHDEANWPQVYDALGLADYPIFDEGYRPTLNDKIIRHYYTREIGAETVGRFRLFVRDAMFLIMPYYNQLYESEVIAKGMEPLGDRNIKQLEQAGGTSSSEGSTGTESTDTTKSLYQDTPQSEILPADVDSATYATNYTMGKDESTSTGKSTSSGKYANTVERAEQGYSRPQSELLKLYRETFLNIDRRVVEDRELVECFMTIW